jgi:hypothetical protein
MLKAKALPVPKQQIETDSESDDQEFDENDLLDDNNRLSDDEDFPISEESDNEVEETEKKGGWASSMAKILNSEKSAVLSKAKKIEDLEKKKEKKSYTFEIDGEVKTEKPDDQKPSEDVLKQALEKKKRREKREVS